MVRSLRECLPVDPCVGRVDDRLVSVARSRRMSMMVVLIGGSYRGSSVRVASPRSAQCRSTAAGVAQNDRGAARTMSRRLERRGQETVIGDRLQPPATVAQDPQPGPGWVDVPADNLLGVDADDLPTEQTGRGQAGRVLIGQRFGPAADVDAAAHAGPELRLIVGCGVIDDEGDPRISLHVAVFLAGAQVGAADVDRGVGIEAEGHRDHVRAAVGADGGQAAELVGGEVRRLLGGERVVGEQVWWFGFLERVGIAQRVKARWDRDDGSELWSKPVDEPLA